MTLYTPLSMSDTEDQYVGVTILFFSGAFAKLPEQLLAASFLSSACLSVCPQGKTFASNGQIFIKIYFGLFLENLLGKFRLR
jgi:hypothetical protein